MYNARDAGPSSNIFIESHIGLFKIQHTVKLSNKTPRRTKTLHSVSHEDKNARFCVGYNGYCGYGHVDAKRHCRTALYFMYQKGAGVLKFLKTCTWVIRPLRRGSEPFSHRRRFSDRTTIGCYFFHRKCCKTKVPQEREWRGNKKKNTPRIKELWLLSWNDIVLNS